MYVHSYTRTDIPSIKVVRIDSVPSEIEQILVNKIKLKPESHARIRRHIIRDTTKLVQD